MVVSCDRKTCKHCKWTIAYDLRCSQPNCITLKGGKCTNYEKLTAEEMKIKRQNAPFKNIY